MFSSYGVESPVALDVKDLRDVEEIVRRQMVDVPLPPIQKSVAIELAVKYLIAQELTKKKSMKGFSIGDITGAINHAVQQVSDVATRVTKPISEPVVKTVVGVSKQIAESVQDIYAENFGPRHNARIPANDELLKSGDMDGNGFILTNKINRLLPVGVSLNLITKTQQMMGSTQWHELNYQVNHLLPWLINNGWISFNSKTTRWNMPFRSGIGQMNGTGRYGTGDFLIDIYGWHNLNDEAMLGTITTFAPIFGYTDQQKADLTNEINSLGDSVQHKSGKEWNRNAVMITATVVAVVAVAVFVGPAVLGAVQGAVAAGAGALGLAVPATGATAALLTAGESYAAKEVLKPVTDPLTKQMVDATTGAVLPQSVVLPDNSLNFDTVLKSIQLNPNLTPQQKNNAAIVIKKNQEIQKQSSEKLLWVAGGIFAVSVVGFGIYLFRK